MIPVRPLPVKGKCTAAPPLTATARTGTDEPRRLSRKMNLRKSIDRTSHVLSNFETADEDHLYLLLGFDDHALKYLSHDLIVIADRVIC